MERKWAAVGAAGVQEGGAGMEIRMQGQCEEGEWKYLFVAECNGTIMLRLMIMMMMIFLCLSRELLIPMVRHSGATTGSCYTALNHTMAHPLKDNRLDKINRLFHQSLVEIRDLSSRERSTVIRQRGFI